jgi:hypothetical protein
LAVEGGGATIVEGTLGVTDGKFENLYIGGAGGGGTDELNCANAAEGENAFDAGKKDGGCITVLGKEGSFVTVAEVCDFLIQWKQSPFGNVILPQVSQCFVQLFVV